MIARRSELSCFVVNISRGAFCCACAKKVCSARSAPFRYFQRAFAGFQLSDRHLSMILFGKGWKSMTSLPPFLTLWILVEFAGSSDEDILMIKVRTKREKRPKTWSLRFDLLTIKMCTWDYKPWRLVLRCWFLTSMNHEVVCGGDRLQEGKYFKWSPITWDSNDTIEVYYPILLCASTG